jgi:hypothetical protein
LPGCTHCSGSHTGRRPCLATATTKTRAWLLIEHPGPWGEDIGEMPLPAPLAGALARARRHGVRVQLIRAPRRRRTTPPLQVYAGFSGGAGPDAGHVWLEGRELADPVELDDLDLGAVGAGRAPGFGTPVTAPVLLVCTNGRHNACCARLGGPLARFLDERFAGVWETTHVGGDRYAANLVCLPDGLYYGDLDPARATEAVEAYRNGRVVLDGYRGRAGLPEPVQAAEHFVRSHTGVMDTGGVVVESMTDDTAVVRAGLARYEVRVERTPLGACGPECREDIGSYAQRDLTLLNGTTLV